MKILALETSARTGSIALLERERLVRQFDLGSTQRMTQTLAPAIVAELGACGWRPDELDLIAVTQGPGSFTGLRVGVTTAKTLAYAVNACVLGINTLEVIAQRTPDSIERFVVVMDAMRGQFFRATYHRRADRTLELVTKTAIVDLETLKQELDRQTAITGPGAEQLAQDEDFSVRLVDAAFRFPQAADVGRLAWDQHNAGIREDLWSLAPRYYRKSAAEEKLTEPK